MSTTLHPATGWPASSTGVDAVRTCLDAVAMQHLLQSELPIGLTQGAEVVTVRITQVRRSASRRRHPNPLTLCYEVDLLHSGTGRRWTQRLYGKVCRGGVPATADPSVALQVPALDLCLWLLPCDPGLPQLARLMDPAATLRWWGTPAEAVTTLRHEPERRATLRYSRPGADGRPEHLYAKTFCDTSAERIHARFTHFWNLACDDATAPTVAQPLGFDPGTRSVWQRAASGTPLLSRLASAHDSRLPAATASALAHLHAAPTALAGPVPRDRAHGLVELRRRQEKIARAAPDLADRARQLVDRLQFDAQGLAEPALSLIHGDCHPDQLWVDGPRIVLFDFDEFALGDPMEDLAAFVLKLGAAPGGSGFATLMLASYAQQAPERFCAQRLHWHLVVQQLLQTCRAFIFQVQGWQRELEDRLARAESMAAQGGQELPA